MRHLIKAIQAQDEPPCKKFECAQYQACADELLACGAFGYNVNNGRSVHPHNAVRETGGIGNLTFVGSVSPTREVYEAVENDRFGVSRRQEAG